MNIIKPQEVLTNYQGSKKTYEMVSEQIKERFGEEEQGNFNPYQNCCTYKQWLSLGYRVKKGETSLKSITFIEKKDRQGNVVGTYPRTVHLFYITQVEKI